MLSICTLGPRCQPRTSTTASGVSLGGGGGGGGAGGAVIDEHDLVLVGRDSLLVRRRDADERIRDLSLHLITDHYYRQVGETVASYVMLSVLSGWSRGILALPGRAVQRGMLRLLLMALSAIWGCQTPAR